MPGQAEPLIVELVQRGTELRQKVEADLDFDGKREWLAFPPELPATVACLIQCLTQEAEVAKDTLTNALQLAAFFAQGCRSKDNWRALSVGPHGKELLHQAWLLYESMQWPEVTWLRNTCAVLAAFRHEDAYGLGYTGHEELRRLIRSDVREDIGLGLLNCAGLLWASPGMRTDVANALPLEDVGSRLFLEDSALCEAAIWAWASIHRERQSPPRPSPRNIGRLMSMWLSDNAAKRSFHVAAYALCQHMGLLRDAWSPVLTEAQVRQVRVAAYASTDDPEVRSNSLCAAAVVAFHARSIWTDDELGALLVKLGKGHRLLNIRGQAEDRDRILYMLGQMGETGKEYLNQL